jgi:NADPH-dependent glutamate synthase beta subunit-like oxidoreductase
MAIRGICPDMARDRIALEIEKHKTKKAAFQALGEEMGVAPQTIKSWNYRGVANATRETRVSPSPESCPEGGQVTTPPKPKPKRGRDRANQTGDPMVMSEEFKAAFDAMFRAINSARDENWKATSQKAALHYLNILTSVATRGA